jgi:hypothetical protein
MTPTEIATIRALSDAATPGPWVGRAHGDRRTGRWGLVTKAYGAGGQVARCMRLDDPEADARFIAEARSIVPELLAEVERLTEALDDRVFNVECWELSRADLASARAENARLREAIKSALYYLPLGSCRACNASTAEVDLRAAIAEPR